MIAKNMQSKKIDKLIAYTALFMCFFIVFNLMWGLSSLIPDASFMSGLKIRWWAPAYYIFLPLTLLSFISTFVIKSTGADNEK